MRPARPQPPAHPAQANPATRTTRVPRATLDARGLLARLAAWAALASAAALSTGIAGCAGPLEQAQALQRAGQPEAALALLEQAHRAQPGDTALRATWLRQRGQRALQLLAQADAARSAGRLDEAQARLAQARALDAEPARAAQIARDLARAQRQREGLAAAESAWRAGRMDEAEALLRPLLAEEPGHPAAGELRRRIAASRPPAGASPQPDAALQQPVQALDFRDAPLRQVFDALGQLAGLGFVFDREVRADARLTLQLRDTRVDEALRIVLATQQLERKLLNPRTLLIYPATAAKQREHQELQTRAFYLANADVAKAQLLLRTLAKVRDLHVDERLNLLLVRETPEVLQQVEKLLATVDLPDPEVMLEVEVLELASDRVDSLGLGWPDAVSYGAYGSSVPATAALGDRGSFRSWVANPALLATLKGNSGAATLISNPSIRVRNRDKARVLVGDKLPVFTTTATANVGVSASVSYLDVGLKLEIEPAVLLGNEVALKVALEVSNLVKEVSGPSGSLAYQVGTRSASTSLRLQDGQTQVLAGLISDEDRQRAAGIPGLSTLAGVGPLFGVQSSSRSKTEVVLLITPRVLRNLDTPDAAGLWFDSGPDASPGAPPLRLSPTALGAVGLAGPGPAGPTAAGAAAGAAGAAPATGTPAATETGWLRLAASAAGRVGEVLAVTLRNDSALAVRGLLRYDPALLQPATDGGGHDGRLRFELPPRGEKALPLRPMPAARGQMLAVSLDEVQARAEDGRPAPIEADREVTIDVDAR